jgi:hypothetical protein
MERGRPGERANPRRFPPRQIPAQRPRRPPIWNPRRHQPRCRNQNETRIARIFTNRGCDASSLSESSAERLEFPATWARHHPTNAVFNKAKKCRSRGNEAQIKMKLKARHGLHGFSRILPDAFGECADMSALWNAATCRGGWKAASSCRSQGVSPEWRLVKA